MSVCCQTCHQWRHRQSGEADQGKEDSFVRFPVQLDDDQPVDRDAGVAGVGEHDREHAHVHVQRAEGVAVEVGGEVLVQQLVQRHFESNGAHDGEAEDCAERLVDDLIDEDEEVDGLVEVFHFTEVSEDQVIHGRAPCQR